MDIDLKSCLPIKFFTACLDKFSLPELNANYSDSDDTIELLSSISCLKLSGSYAEKLQLPPYFVGGSSDFDWFFEINNESENAPGYVSLSLDINAHVTKERLCAISQELMEYTFPEEGYFNTQAVTWDSGPALSTLQKSNFTDNPTMQTNFDFVPTIRMAGWPKEAAKFAARERTANWPPSHLIEDIMSRGYHLVNKHPKATEQRKWRETGMDKYWRISFSLAETMVALSLSESQRQAVILMKMLKSKLPSHVITTYHIKTSAYWTFESLPAKLARRENLGLLFFYLLDRLILSLTTRNLPHFFMDSVNLLEGVSRDHLVTVLKELIKFRKRPFDIFRGSLIGGMTALGVAGMKGDDTHDTQSDFSTDSQEQSPIPWGKTGESISNGADDMAILDAEYGLYQFLDYLKESPTEPSEKIEMAYKQAKIHLESLEKTEGGIGDASEPQFSKEFLEILQNTVVTDEDKALLQEKKELNGKLFLNLTLTSPDLDEAVFSTLCDLHSPNCSEKQMEYTFSGFIEGIQILTDWALSQKTPREEIVNYIDDVYMQDFFLKTDPKGKSKLSQFWRLMKYKT